ncbi:GNAT family N-acetyltransferase [Ensifer adhaerens]|uniref:GNAT family N-acetyltransferase n=1 Tax=Ensifer adhaerens TaxID=106592 RepID=UPI00098FD8E6|nr:GNAT family N-acetyltransferase [Ensifer adhaerens]
MQKSQFTIEPFAPHHVEGAHNLSCQANWPHRREDWEMVAALSTGVVAIEDERVIGTTFTTRYGDDCATVNMVIVDEAMRGLGLGRRLMDASLEAAGDLPCRLIATDEGLPLYRKLGFRETGTVRQHQGICPAVKSNLEVEWAAPDDFQHVLALDKEAFGGDRHDLLVQLRTIGRFAVLRRHGALVGYSCLRAFGRGEVIGPVAAENLADAKQLILFLMAARPGAFVRIDTTSVDEISSWLSQQGLPHVGGGTAMQRGETIHLSGNAKIFALANQAFG